MERVYIKGKTNSLTGKTSYCTRTGKKERSYCITFLLPLSQSCTSNDLSFPFSLVWIVHPDWTTDRPAASGITFLIATFSFTSVDQVFLSHFIPLMNYTSICMLIQKTRGHSFSPLRTLSTHKWWGGRRMMRERMVLTGEKGSDLPSFSLLFLSGTREWVY